MNQPKPEALIAGEITLAPAPTQLPAAMTLQMAKEQNQLIRQFCFEVLKEGTDYGVIPGTSAKKVLLKPGAEHLCQLLRLYPRFSPVQIIEDFSKPLFHYRYECQLIHTTSGQTVGTGIGSCNSMEKKYRWRDAKPKCPECGQEAIFRSKFEDRVTGDKGYYCFAKKGGCGAQFPSTDTAISTQKVGQIENPDIFDQVNTIDKMAQKRALLAATLIAAGVSEYFTQDLDDFQPMRQPEPPPPEVDQKTGEVSATPKPSIPPKKASTKPKPKPAKPKVKVKGPDEVHTHNEITAVIGVEIKKKLKDWIKIKAKHSDQGMDAITAEVLGNPKAKYIHIDKATKPEQIDILKAALERILEENK